MLFRSEVDSTCKGCKYLGTISTGKCCNYSIIEGHSRGCRAGTECIRYSGPPRQKAAPPKTEPRKEAASVSKPHRPHGLTPEEAYERDKIRKQERIKKNRERLHGIQKAALTAFKEETGYTNRKIAEMLGVKESRIQFWCNEYAEADWELLGKIGITKPEGIGVII